MALTWVAADFRTGRIVADLPSLDCDYPLRRTIGRYESATAHLNLNGAPPDWEYATREGGAVLAAYDEDDPAATIQWAGFVTQQIRRTADDVVDLVLATCEAYFDRRFVGDVRYMDRAQNFIVSDLVARYVVDGAGGNPGIPLLVSASGGSTLRTRTYLDADNATVYTRLTQLMAASGGPEFTVEWTWSPDRLSLLPVLVVADRIGAAVPAGRAPAAVFDMPGCVTEAEQVRDYSSGKGANKVSAYSSGQGDAAPTSGPIRAANYGGRPTFEFRWSPSSSITDVATLKDYARQALAILAPGARGTTLTAALAEAPKLGDSWRLGDDVGYLLGGLDDQGRDTVLAFPGGYAGVGRVIAYELTPTTISPILADTVIPGEDDTDGGAA